MANFKVQYSQILYQNNRSSMTVTPELYEADAPGLRRLAFRQSVKPGYEAAYVEAMRNLIYEVNTAPGYRSCDVIRLSNTNQEWFVIIRFDSLNSLHRWESSKAHQAWWRTSQELSHQIQIIQAEDPEDWLVLSAQTNGLPKWKMAFLTIIGLYPLVLWVFPHLASLTGQLGLAEWLGKLVTVMLAVPFMTWVIVPLLMHLLRRWLY